MCSRLHQKRHHAVNPDQREQQRTTGKRAKQPCVESRLPDRFSHYFFHRRNFTHRQVRIDLRHFTPKPLRKNVAAVSVGFVQGELVLDLPYAEDSIADADVNVVATSEGELIEVQGTAERRPFSRGDFDRVLELALKGIAQLVEAQNTALRK